MWINIQYDERYMEMRPILIIKFIFIFKSAGKNAFYEKCDKLNSFMVSMFLIAFHWYML